MPTPRSHPFRALAHRNFRLFCVGQGVSLVGTWAQQVAAAWLVYELTGSPLWLGLAAFAGQAPAFVLAPLAGVWVDRWDRHRVLMATQTLAMLQAFALAALALTGVVNVWQVLVLNALLGAVSALDMTARQAFLTQLVADREDVGNAIALNSSLVNAARLVGPAVAGLLLAKVGAGGCFLFNGVTYLAVLAALAAMAVPEVEPRVRTRSVGEELREGLLYALGFPPIRAVLVMLAAVSVAGSAYTTLLPVYAAGLVTEGRGAGAFGLLSAASGVGALAAALMLATRGTVLGLGRWIAAAPAVFGFALVCASATGSLVPAALALALAGFGVMAHMAASNTVLQTIVDEDKRGRVMSLYTAAFLGSAPLGSLLAGFLAGSIGVPATLRLAGVGCVIGAAVFVSRLSNLRQLVLPIYVRLGVLPEPGLAEPVSPVLVVPEGEPELLEEPEEEPEPVIPHRDPRGLNKKTGRFEIP